MATLCRDCLTEIPPARRCPRCGSPRVLSHPELFDLSIAHMDCDAFYASVEKRDNPELAGKPVIIGGGRRGVVSTACYVARIRGVRSAMPMFQALKLCPEAVIIKPRMEVYVEASRAIRAMMEEMTPAIEPLSLDEAFLDMTGTARLHGQPPAMMLARLVRRMKTELGLTGSIGLSHNKFLAKVASDLDKPHGFSVIGAGETADFLRDKPVGMIWGVGAATQTALEKAGIRSFSDLLRWEQTDLIARFGSMGDRLWHLARGQDTRRVSRHRPVKSISNETTFSDDTGDAEILDGHIWRLAEKVADRAKAKEMAGRVVTLKLKRADHTVLSRRLSLHDPTQLADRIYRTARALFDQVDHQSAYRLIGVGLSELSGAEGADMAGDLLDPGAAQRSRAERAADSIRSRFGEKAIVKGRALR
ncbi:DNA polymerase IV [Sulfitobacter sp. KE29]|uniref:DNA polymerase IV n=1 Tax=unclassified Sulfitobacter TaxID=196795 RepID=UPI0010AB733A|nr:MULTISPECIES: DNA polymerase IV [unclassified Sulfitobacter]MBO9438409.1 DNA polymerase IV [Sulfitobacter sp. R18_2]MDF3417824.1 DNA polymerase IV [Sulfitobacter sp. Ks38]MDF3425306.1 DNA polymerase IV [Sulfitobacter sp. KE29]MDF3428887.1 DNA polymerase IV [Sulfitobacter sp. S46]MDF3443659.1 DNA polymerase IV [Sulfitobacter sp. KE31]